MFLIEANRKPNFDDTYFSIAKVNQIAVACNAFSILDIAEIIALRLE